MIIKYPQAQDILQLRQLWQEAFGDSEAFLDGFYATGYESRRCRVVQMQQRPVAALYWFDCWLEGKKLAYIYAVATEKAYRGRGLCRMLIEDTHGILAKQGYSAAVLVPGSEKLFSMYEKLGYRAFCPMTRTTVAAGQKPMSMRQLTASQYFNARGEFLPADGIRQDSVADYLATFTDFYCGEGFLCCLARENDTLLVQEFLGDPSAIPGLVKALGAEKASLRLPGGSPYGMYHSLDGTDLQGAYFGIALG